MTLPKRFEGKTAVITGAASGIGASTARRLSAEGAQIILVDKDEPQGQSVAEETKGRFYAADLSQRADIETVFNKIISERSEIDVLVNNAGIGGTGVTTPDLEPDVWRSVMAVNIDAIFLACRIAIPAMRANGGAIINVASISGLFGDYGFTAYNASKGAVVNYTRALALDHAGENIRVNAVCPGFIETSLTEQLNAFPDLLEVWRGRIPMQRAGKPNEIAATIAFLASNEASYITGSVLTADGGLTAGTGQPNIQSYFAS